MVGKVERPVDSMIMGPLSHFSGCKRVIPPDNSQFVLSLFPLPQKQFPTLQWRLSLLLKVPQSGSCIHPSLSPQMTAPQGHQSAPRFVLDSLTTALSAYLCFDSARDVDIATRGQKRIIFRGKSTSRP
ncbi:hypothetical protein STEG23_035589 [Scotinomys teguina]